MRRDQRERELEILLDQAFSNLTFRENILMIFYALFCPKKRDQFLDLVLKGKDSKEAFNKINKNKKLL